MIQGIFSKIQSLFDKLLNTEDIPLVQEGTGIKGFEYAALSSASGPIDTSGFNYRRDRGAEQQANDQIFGDPTGTIATRLSIARRTLEQMDRFATMGKAVFSNGQEFVLGISYGSHTGGIPRQIVAERQNRFKNKLKGLLTVLPNGYRPGRFESESNPTYGNSGKPAPAELHMFTTHVPDSKNSEFRAATPRPDFSSNLFIKRQQLQFTHLNEKIAALPNGQASMFIGWTLDPQDVNSNGAQALCHVLQYYVDKALELGYEVAGPIGFPLIEEIRNPFNPNDRAIEFVMHIALRDPGEGRNLPIIPSTSLKELVPGISPAEADQLRAQEGEHHNWDNELDRNCYTLGTVKVAAQNENRIGFSANIVCGYDSFEGARTRDEEFEKLSPSEFEREVEKNFFNPDGRLDISQLFYNLGIKMQKTAWQLYERGGSEARRGPTHFVVGKAPYADEHTEEYLRNHSNFETGLSKPSTYFLIELSAWRNVTGGVNAYNGRVPFELLQLPHDGFRRGHQNRRGIMNGWDRLLDKATGAWTSQGSSYFYFEHMAGSAYKRRDGKIPEWGMKPGFRFSEYLSVQLKDVVSLFNTYTDAQITEFRPSDVVFAGNFDPGSPGAGATPTNIDRLNLRIRAVKRSILTGEESPPDKIDYMKFNGARERKDYVDTPRVRVEEGDDLNIGFEFREDHSTKVDNITTLRRAFENGLTFWKNKRFFLCQVYQDAKLYLYEAKLRFFNELSLGGLEGVYFSAKKLSRPNDNDQIWLTPTFMIGVDDDTFGQQGRDCHTGTLLSINELEELFSGKYRALGYPRGEFISIDTDQNWGFIQGEFGGQIFQDTLDISEEIAFCTIARIGISVLDRDYTEADWNNRVTEAAIWIHDESKYHLIEKALIDRSLKEKYH